MIGDLDFGVFDEVEYLSFLNHSVSSELPTKIGGYISWLDRSLTAADLVEPLRSGKFPRQNLKEYHWILGEMITGWPTDLTSEDPYDTVYVCSFYLFSHLNLDAGPTDLVPLATVLLVQACDKDCSLLGQCLRYLQWLMTIVRDVERRESNPIVFLLLSLIAMLGFSLGALTVVTEDIFERDKIKDPDAQNALVRCVSDVARELWSGVAVGICGRSGRLEQTCQLFGKLLNSSP